jgi:hypothetical protein
LVDCPFCREKALVFNDLFDKFEAGVEASNPFAYEVLKKAREWYEAELKKQIDIWFKSRSIVEAV